MIEDIGPRSQTLATGNTTVVVVGNTTSSNIAKSGETVVSATISQIFWTTDNVITISRGNTKVMTLPPGTDHWNFRAAGFTLIDNPTGNLVITTAASCNCSVIVELTKKVTNP